MADHGSNGTIQGGVIFDALLGAARKYGASKPILEDQERAPLSYTDLIRASFALGTQDRRSSLTAWRTRRTAAPLEQFGSRGDVFRTATHLAASPAMLNFTAGLRNLRAAVKLAGDKACAYLAQLHRAGQAARRDRRARGALRDHLSGGCAQDDRRRRPLPWRWRRLAVRASGAGHEAAPPDDPGVILFTSGSFGAPRGVVLTQANLVANADQIATHIALDPAWVLLQPPARLPLLRPDRRRAACPLMHRHEGV